MAYPVKSFYQIRDLILQEVRNLTGIDAPDDSDAAIRADGEAAVVEGLYQNIKWVERQLFISTADEPYLYIHAEKIVLPRLGGTLASGTVTAVANVGITIPSTAKLTDGKGYYWSVAGNIELTANMPVTIEILADQVGSGWNFSGTSLMWVAPEAGLQSTATVISITGGSDGEDLEDWRARLLERQQLGLSRDRAADFVSVVKSVPGVRDVFPFPKRRGLGSVDVAVTAAGNPAMLPTDSLLNNVQTVLDEYAGFWADCRAYSPVKEYVNILAEITGTASKSDIEFVIQNYMNALAPADTYQPSILIGRILQVDGVSDVQLNTPENISPTNDWQITGWLRLGLLEVKFL